MHTCNICKYSGRPIYKSPCSECKEFSEYEYENKKTNADIIRSMSDEEIAGLIRVIYMSEECPLGTLECETCFFEEVCAGIYCGKEIEWLKQPAEGE